MVSMKSVLGNGLSLAVLFGLGKLTGTESYALQALAVNWAAFLLHAYPLQSEQLYDAVGMLTHLSLVIRGAVSVAGRPTTRQLLNSFAVVIWTTRLGSFLLNRILRDGKDKRFTAIKAAGFLSFLVPFTMQALWCFLTDLPVLILNTSELQDSAASELTVLDYLGWALWAIGIGIESIADMQKSVFRANPENKHRFISSGLWAYSRHPNHFGEILLWVGVTLSCLNQFQRPLDYLGLLSPMFTAYIVLGVSGVPMLEAQGMKEFGKDPEYLRYIRTTNTIVPWFPKASN